MSAVICLLAVAQLHGQTVRRVHGEYVYYAPEDVSLEEAKQTALSRAKTQAIADTWGTVVAQHNATVVHNADGQSSSDFSSISSSDVRGEWIETIGTPQYEISYQKGMLVVKCTVSGKAREITQRATEFVAKLLRNGTDDRYEAHDFKSGDDLYLSFQSATDTYLAVYLVDNTGNAFCLLPYRSSKDGRVKVDANTHYLFFSADNASPLCSPSEVDEYTMTCEHSVETNYIYVISSPHPFTKAVDTVGDESLPRQLPFDLFEKWLSKNRTRDNDMQVDIKTITVTME